MACDGREGGFIKLHRRLLSSALWRSMTAEQRSVLVAVLFLANWKPDVARWRDRFYRVERGELAHTLESIAEEAATSVKVVRSALKAMLADDTAVGGNGPFLRERYPISGTGPGTGPRVLTVVNYSKYQDVPETEGMGSGTGRARVGHGSGTGGAEREEGEEGEEPSPHSPPSRWDDLRSRLTTDQVATMEQQRAALVAVLEAQRLWPAEERARVQEIDDRLFAEWSSVAASARAAGGA